MSEIYQQQPNDARSTSILRNFFSSFFQRKSTNQKATQSAGGVLSRRPGAARPVWVEGSPATANPFPEPQTMPDGWDLSELLKP
jgi:hypothetical protein